MSQQPPLLQRNPFKGPRQQPLRAVTLRLGYLLRPAGLDSSSGLRGHITAATTAPTDSGRSQESSPEAWQPLQLLGASTAASRSLWNRQ